MFLSKHVNTNQEDFFNKNATTVKTFNTNNFFYNYVNKEQIVSFNWISDAKKILEYGVGTGTSLDIFLQNRDSKKYEIYGVDIAEEAIKVVSAKYPYYKFIKITNNSLKDIPDNCLDAVYMLHLLHHTHDHIAIFKEIYKKLKPNGKLVINDLTSKNPFVSIGRLIFSIFPKIFKHKFSDDLVVVDTIPDKYPVNVSEIVTTLKDVGFAIEKVGYGHLFFHIFAWFDKFILLSNIRFFQSIYSTIFVIEDYLLNFSFFRNFAELFYIFGVKHNDK